MISVRLGTQTVERLNKLSKYDRHDMVYKLCNTEGLFTHGSTEQYGRMFDALDRGDYDFVVVALTLCSEAEDSYLFKAEEKVARLLAATVDVWYYNIFGGDDNE